MSGSRIAAVAFCALATAFTAASCGGDDGPDTGGDGSGGRSSVFGSALGALGAANGLTGKYSAFGWDDIDALRGYPVDTDFGADSLGTGVRELIAREARIFHATGFAPSYSASALSEDGPPGSGVRFDGAHAGRLVNLLLDSGAQTSRKGPWRLFDIGPDASDVTGPLSALGPLISYVAISSDAVVFADAEPIRGSLTGDGGSFEPSPELEAGLDCLGDVVAARTVPVSSASDPAAPEVLAVGVEPLNEDVPPHDVACAVDRSAERSDARAAAMEAALPSANVSRESDGDLEIARAEIEPSEGEKPSALLRAYARGELLGYLGLEGAG